MCGMAMSLVIWSFVSHRCVQACTLQVLIFALIGVASMLAIIIYNVVVSAANANPTHSLNTHGDRWVRAFLIPICLMFAVAVYYDPTSIGLWLNTAFFYIMLLVSVTGKTSKM